MSLAILFHFLCTQHVSDINVSIIRNLRLCCWITTSVILFSGRCVLEIWCGWVWVVSVLQVTWCHLLFYFTSYVLNMFRTLIYPSSGTCDCAVELPHRSQGTCNTDTTRTQLHQISNTQRTANNTTDVVIQQHSRKFLMMDILMSETCWVHKKWNKIASDIKLVFYSSATCNSLWDRVPAVVFHVWKKVVHFSPILFQRFLLIQAVVENFQSDCERSNEKWICPCTCREGLLYNGYRVVPGGRGGRGVGLTPHHHLVPMVLEKV